MYQRILVPVHGDPQDVRAIDIAASLINHDEDAELTLVYVVEVPQEFALDADLPEVVDRGEAVLSQAAQYAERHEGGQWRNISTELLQARSAASAIVDEALDRDVDAIVLASCNRRRLGVVSQGETVPYVLNNAPCDVILVRTTGQSGGWR